MFVLPPTDVEAQWCSQGDLLAVAGMERLGLPAESACVSITRNALVKFYNVQGEHIYTLETPAQVSRGLLTGMKKKHFSLKAQ